MRLTARSSIIGALAVALVAVALAPGASAGYRLTHQEAARFAQQSGQSASFTTGVRPNPDQQSTQAGPVGPPILRVARASELATIHRAEVQREAARSYGPAAAARRYSSAETGAYAAFAHPVAAGAPTVKAPGDGFDFGAAAVGGGLAVAIIVLVGAGGLALRRRRQPQYG
jgi:hypothetical protein